MKCREIIKLISDYIDREIEETLKEIFEEHIRICERCRYMLNSVEKTIFISRKIYKNKKIPKKFEKKLFYQLKIRYKK